MSEPEHIGAIVERVVKKMISKKEAEETFRDALPIQLRGAFDREHSAVRAIFEAQWAVIEKTNEDIQGVLDRVLDGQGREQ